MKLLDEPRRAKRLLYSAFTLVEVLVAVGVMGVMFLSLYTGLSAGLGVVAVSRENLRATQIMVEKLEIMRLYTWDQINSNGFVPTTFTAYFYPSNAVNSSDAGIKYAGTVTITNAPFSVAYSNEIKQVTISLTWTSGSVTRNRSMQTLVTDNGLQRYVY